jgi:hypothetical protein
VMHTPFYAAQADIRKNLLCWQTTLLGRLLLGRAGEWEALPPCTRDLPLH